MARFKKFTGGRDISEFEPLEFELNGVEFRAKPAIQGAVLLAFVRDASSDDGGDSAGALYNFLESALTAEEYVRFQEVLNDDKIIIDIEVIGEIVSWLVSEYSERPTEQPEDSLIGRQTSGTTSTEERSYRE